MKNTLFVFVILLMAVRANADDPPVLPAILDPAPAPAPEPKPAPAPAAQSTVEEKRAQEKRLLEEALKSLSQEPTLAQLEKAALKLADADMESVKRWKRALNASAALPVVKITAEHDMERDESLDRYQDEPDRWGADTDKDLGFQVSAQWYLNELIFNPDEVRVYGAIANRAQRRETLLMVLVGYYFERRRLQLKQILAPPTELQEIIKLELKIEQLGASIDALTGGLLSSNLSKSEDVKSATR